MPATKPETSYATPDVAKPQQPLVKRVLARQFRSRCSVLFAVMTIMAFVVVAQSGIKASRGYELVRIQKQAETVEAENQRLQLEISQLKSPERIQQIATTQLGMEVPRKVYFAHENK